MSRKTTYFLKGKIVTMTSENAVFPDGYIFVKDNLILEIYNTWNEIPEEHQQIPVIETNGVIYPGLIDLHNHFVYNVLPLWIVPRQYDNRSQWPRHNEYRSDVSKPIRDALAKFSPSAKAIVRYVEVKAILGGTTTGQGMRTQVRGGSKIFEGAMRNVEEPMNENLPPAGTRVPDLYVGGATADERIDSFRRALNRPGQGAYFYHLSEGIDDRSRQHFFNLRNFDLINDKLVGIHSLGLETDDLVHLSNFGAKVVWSPFSNQLLYGKTLDLRALKDSGLSFSIGCDWSPTGSKNLLQELKVASFTNIQQDKPFSSFDLVKAVTANAAAVTAWHDYLGTIEKGKIADLIVVKNKSNDPYDNLISAIEKDIELVVIDGCPRYGNQTIMQMLMDTNDLETLAISGIPKALHLFTPKSEINDVKFKEATTSLTEVMSDLYGYIERMEQEEARLLELGETIKQEFSIVLDNEFEINEDVFRDDEQVTDPQLLADVPMAAAVDLDSAIVEGVNYWNRIERQPNISIELKEFLKSSYND